MTEISLDEIAVGHRFTSSRRTITDADITSFSSITGDYSVLHSDLVYIKNQTPFRDRIAQGWLLVTVQSGLNSDLKQWRMLAYLGMERRFIEPVYPGDTIHAEYVVDEVRPSQSKPDRGVVTLSCAIVNQDGQTVSTGTETFLVARDDQ
ncbi:MaoC family dehydratase [Rhodococcus koreensis]